MGHSTVNLRQRPLKQANFCPASAAAKFAWRTYEGLQLHSGQRSESCCQYQRGKNQTVHQHIDQKVVSTDKKWL